MLWSAEGASNTEIANRLQWTNATVGKPQAESEERRPLIKEKHSSIQHAHTQSGIRVSQGLAGVRKAARERKEMKFTALLHHLTVALLRDSFYALKRKAAPGVDGIKWQEYETGLEDRLIDLHNLNISRRKSLTDAHGAEVGAEVWSRFTVHYTPRHGSWLNRAEIETSLFARQCLGKRRMPNLQVDGDLVAVHSAVASF